MGIRVYVCAVDGFLFQTFNPEADSGAWRIADGPKLTGDLYKMNYRPST